MKFEKNYNYQFEWDSKYCYPKSPVLKNKLNIHDAEAFQNTEKSLTSIVLQELIEFPVQGNFDFNHLRAIHKAIFEDIFTWVLET